MSREKGYDEVFCASCGETIKKQAELCPHCGVRNQEASQATSTDKRRSGANATLGRVNDSTSFDIEQLLSYTLRGAAWLFGVLFLLAGLGAFFSGSGIVGVIISIFQGVFFLLIGAILLPPTRKRLSREYPVTRIGWVRSTGEAVIQNADEPCSACYDGITKGVARTYREQFVLFGVPLFTKDEGNNVYCRNCASGEPSVEMTDQELAQA